MKVQKVDNSSPSFQKLKMMNGIPKDVENALLDSKAIKRFGQKYNANIGYTTVFDTENNNHPAIILEEIESATWLGRLIEKVKRNFNLGRFMYLATEKLDNEHLISKIKNLPKNALVKEYKKSMKPY